MILSTASGPARGRPSPSSQRLVPATLEPLEARQLLSITHGPVGGPFSGGGQTYSTIAFSLAPAAAQTGLTALATTDGLAVPTATSKVALGNSNGVETYSITSSSTGTVSRLTVDAAGDPVTSPTQTTTTFSALAAAPAAEITAIATAQGLTAPTATTVVNVTTTAAGAVTYSVPLTGPSVAEPLTAGSTVGTFPTRSVAVMVDAAGDPVGNQRLPFSVFSSTIQAALKAGAPAGATALTDTSSQTVDVTTFDGVTTYSTTFGVTGTDTTVIVNAAGATVVPASRTTLAFSAIPAASQTELQALATADGYAGTIATTQSVTVYTETGVPATLYAVTLGVTGSTTTSSHAREVTFVVDASGNPTTLPMGAAGPGPVQPVGPIPFPVGPIINGGAGPTGSTSSGSGSTTSTGSAATAVGVAIGSPNAYAAAAAADAPATPTLGSSLALFASVASDTAVAADLAQLKADAATVRSAAKGLSATGAATLRADQKALNAAVRALATTLAPDEKTLRADEAKYAALIRSDESAVRKDRSDATALATAEATLASDQSAAFTALSADLAAVKSLIAADAGVTAARGKLATDVPTVAAAEATVQSDYAQLQTDIGTAVAADASAT